MLQLPDIFGMRHRAEERKQGAAQALAAQVAEKLWAERTELGERLFAEMSTALGERDVERARLRIGKLPKNGDSFSVVYGFVGCAWTDGGGQFDVRLSNKSFLSGEGAFHALFGKYGPEQYYDDFETFVAAACEHLRTVK